MAVLGYVAFASGGPAVHGFRYGVAAAEMTSNSALTWARPDTRGVYTAELAVGRGFRRLVRTVRVVASRANDLTVQTLFRGLRSNTTYYYRFVGAAHRAASAVGRLRTAPPPDANVTVRFAWSGDADGRPSPGSSRPMFGDMAVYGEMARERNDFNVNLGDTIYSGSPYSSVAAKWAKYRRNLSFGNYQRVRGATGMYNQWDDHEFINDFSRPEFGTRLYRAGERAFRDYMPVHYQPSTGIYRSFRWGRNLELFFLDERSFRSAKASAGHRCENSLTGVPDGAPTAPPAIRNRLASLDREFAQPLPRTCLKAINDPRRTMLGRAQLTRFERAIRRSTATWKVIVNEVPIQRFYLTPYDRWEGYAAERAKLLAFLHRHVRHAVFLSTDVHADLAGPLRSGAGDARQPSGSGSGSWEFTTGPVATGTFAHVLDNTLHKPGAGRLITARIFDRPAPGGTGMRCANTSTRSFGEVTVTAHSLTVRLLDARGRLIRDASGSICPAIQLSSR